MTFTIPQRLAMDQANDVLEAQNLTAYDLFAYLMLLDYIRLTKDVNEDAQGPDEQTNLAREMFGAIDCNFDDTRYCVETMNEHILHAIKMGVDFGYISQEDAEVEKI